VPVKRLLAVRGVATVPIVKRLYVIKPIRNGLFACG
jgi:hypothetical protein